MARSLLVARGNQLDLVLSLPQRVEQADVAVPADTEHVGYLLLDQKIGDEISAFHARHSTFLLTGRGSFACDSNPLSESTDVRRLYQTGRSPSHGSLGGDSSLQSRNATGG